MQAHDHTPVLGLDPENWDDFRALTHNVVDDMIDYMQTVRDRAAWTSPTVAAREALSQSVPFEPSDPAEVYAKVKEHILPFPTGNIHPRFWGWVMGNGTPAGFLADIIASAMNCHVSGYDQAATLVENQVLDWLKSMFDYPATGSGLLVSGGTAANLIGIAVPRNTLSGYDVRKRGIDQSLAGRLRIFASTETHGWIDRSCDLLGMGEDSICKVPTNGRDQVDVRLLREAIKSDREKGLCPFCLVGTAGTVATGATDDLSALADLAASEGLWFHVDGAFGALAKLSPKYQHIVAGMERADSIAFDMHKWGYMQYETGAILIRDGKNHQKAFSFSPSYLETFRGGIGIHPTEFASRGIQLSRGFRALRVWVNLMIYGIEKLGQEIERNIDDAQYLRSLVESAGDLELLGPAEMNVVCFRYNPGNLSQPHLDELNRELLITVQESGLAVPSNARIRGEFAIRIANTNHRTVRSDFDLLVNALKFEGSRLAHQ
jgi:glutamate/tyrosine decarboxylase-like PLP-dependent enzyme